jgi:F-type H+-transporting ATPase subunit b
MTLDSIFMLAGIGSDLANTAGQVANDFGLSWPYFIAQVVSFLIVAFCLQRFAYKPILTVLEERKQRIAQSLAEAEKIKQQLAEAEVSRKKTLDEAAATANKMVEEARAAAARISEAEAQKAIATAEQIIAKAREATLADHARMLTELKREVARLVVDTTAKVSGKVLTMEDQRRLTEDANQQIAA